MIYLLDTDNTYYLYFQGGCHLILGRYFWYHKILCVHPIHGPVMGFM